MPEISLAEVQEAAERYAKIVHRATPVFSSRRFNEAAGVACFFKGENLQRGGAFKLRGAANFLLSMTEDERSRGVVTFSSGNHAQAVAIIAPIRRRSHNCDAGGRAEGQAGSNSILRRANRPIRSLA